MNFSPFRKKTIQILSIDGGGIRGYIPALILEKLSKLLKEKSGNGNLASVFDLIAGTSSGALTALGIASPDIIEGTNSYTDKPRFSITEIVNIYETCRTDIFPERVFEQLGMVKQAFQEKYDSSGFELLLNDMFGKRTMGDCLTDILITSFDVLSNKPFLISKNDDFYMKDAARGSSAAPSFFEPALIKSLSTDSEYCLVDGALAANNPSMFAYSEARKLFPKAEKFIIFSLGTGKSDEHYSFEQIKNWGFVEWILPSNGTPLYSIMSKAQNDCVDMQFKNLPEVEYYRINPILGRNNMEIDNISFNNMKKLKYAALNIIEENNTKLKKLAIDLV
jgi:patatin-like phospholipase/acyl hydrolase